MLETQPQQCDSAPGEFGAKIPKNVGAGITLFAILSTHKAKQADEQLGLGAVYKDEDLVFAYADGSPIDPARDRIARRTHSGPEDAA